MTSKPETTTAIAGRTTMRGRTLFGSVALSALSLSCASQPAEPATTTPAVALAPPATATVQPVAAPPAEVPTALLSTEQPLMLNVLPAAAADSPCPPYTQQELREPTQILPNNGVLRTQLVVGLKQRCVPVFANGQWTMQRLALRTYGFPRNHSQPITEQMVRNNPNDPAIVWSAPGPTLVLHKATTPASNADGTNFQMTLYNVLPPQDEPHACDPCPPGSRCAGGTEPTPPNCFHGNNSTNFHMHGSHVSPQPHQDYIGLELLPFGAIPPEHAVHGARGSVAVGKYDFNVDRIRYTQAEGTHWYHAHKHGSTALQVLNGLIGVFEIRGAFDRQLATLFSSQGGLAERLLVVQQLQEQLPMLGGPAASTLEPLINGQANPIVKMRPGEIQRWRFVGATMQKAAHLEIGFTQQPGQTLLPEVRQIAMDGVQFAPQNYACQPILYGADCKPGTADDSFHDLKDFLLAPGNRVDVLVQAPSAPGRYAMTYDVVGALSKDDLQQFEAQKKSRVAAEGLKGGEPSLLTLVVEGTPVPPTAFPSEAQFPKLPAFLADLQAPFKPRVVNYQMTNQGNPNTSTFTINNHAYNPDCAFETMTLDVAEEWDLTNNSGIEHPFHIHTNPFQMVSEKGCINGKLVDNQYKAPYVWRDTLPIPANTGSSGKCTAVGGLGRATIRYRPEEFTGEFVNHCHILGHEDRGMMHNVQVTCPNGQWGKATTGQQPECRDGNYTPAAPQCD